MDTSADPHPAGNGLADSGYVVSVVRTAADIHRVDVIGDDNFIGITLPGNPCGVLLCCSAQGAEALAVRLADGLGQLRDAREKRS
jgi:hypothetical protein